MLIRRNWQKVVFAIAIIIFLGLLTWGVYHLIQPYFHDLLDEEKVRQWAKESGVKGWFIFIFMTAIQVIIAIIPGGPMEIGAGYAYGPIGGTIIILIGVLIGSTTVYLLVKRFGRSFVRIFIDESKIDNLHILQDPQKLNRMTFIIFLIPGTPKDLLTYAVGLTPMPLSTWLMITILARTPATFVSTYGGDALLKKEYGNVITIFVIVMVLSIVGYWVFSKMNEKHHPKKKKLEEKKIKKITD